jgi:hypothetical protein
MAPEVAARIAKMPKMPVLPETDNPSVERQVLGVDSREPKVQLPVSVFAHSCTFALLQKGIRA